MFKSGYFPPVVGDMTSPEGFQNAIALTFPYPSIFLFIMSVCQPPTAVSPMIRLGGNAQGQKLLILHAVGLHAHAYTPLAVELCRHGYDIYALNLPGHGPAADTHLATYEVPVIVEYLVRAVDVAGLRGCLCLGHSAGGAFAILASTRCVCMLRPM